MRRVSFHTRHVCTCVLVSAWMDLAFSVSRCVFVVIFVGCVCVCVCVCVCAGGERA